jgi:hypothetical protein
MGERPDRAEHEEAGRKMSRHQVIALLDELETRTITTWTPVPIVCGRPAGRTVVPFKGVSAGSEEPGLTLRDRRVTGPTLLTTSSVT